MKEIYILVEQIEWNNDVPGTSIFAFNTKKEAIEKAKSEYDGWIRYFEDGGEEIEDESGCGGVANLYGEDSIPGYSFSTSSDNYYQSDIRICRI